MLTMVIIVIMEVNKEDYKELNIINWDISFKQVNMSMQLYIMEVNIIIKGVNIYLVLNKAIIVIIKVTT